MKNAWRWVFKVTDPLLNRKKAYLKFKSKKLPEQKIPAGLSLSCDSSFNVKNGLVTELFNDVDFFEIYTDLGAFEIRLITHSKKSRTYYTVTNLKTNITFTIDKKAFELLFQPKNIEIDSEFKNKYLKLK